MYRIHRNSKGQKVLGAATILIFSIVVLLLFAFFLLRKDYLCLVDENGKEYESFLLNNQNSFSVTFIHSVNKTPVTDYYEIRNNDIYVVKTLYYGFGAGVQTQIEENQTLTYTEDGGMLVSGFDKKIDNLAYVVGMVSDHTLCFDNKEYSLRDLCGKGSYVIFKCKKKFF